MLLLLLLLLLPSCCLMLNHDYLWRCNACEYWCILEMVQPSLGMYCRVHSEGQASLCDALC